MSVLKFNNEDEAKVVLSDYYDENWDTSRTIPNSKVVLVEATEETPEVVMDGWFITVEPSPDLQEYELDTSELDYYRFDPVFANRN